MQVENTIKACEVMDNKTEQEHAALRAKLWQITNDLRGRMGVQDFNEYMIVMLCYRYISEDFNTYINQNQHECGENHFDYTNFSDEAAELGRDRLVEEKGFFIYPSELFVNVLKKAEKNSKDLNEILANTFLNIEKSSIISRYGWLDIKGLLTNLDFENNKLGVNVPQRSALLLKLMHAIADLDLGIYGDNSMPLFRDAYNYLITDYVKRTGKACGEFITPQNVAELLAQITVANKTEVRRVYDPACGSGSLLLAVAKVMSEQGNVSLTGQEIDIKLYNRCRINMFMHNICYEQFNIVHSDSLDAPLNWEERRFDAIVCNPLYSITKETGAHLMLHCNEEEYANYLTPQSEANWAFVLHAFSWLEINGVAAIICHPCELYNGDHEREIKEYLFKFNFITAVIQLPPNLFGGTSIAASILILQKRDLQVEADNKTLFIDASTQFIHQAGKNELTAEHAKRILDCYTNRDEQEHFSRLVDNAEIVANGYNISVDNYVR